MNELVARWRRKNAELKAGTNALLARHPFGENMRPMMREIFAYIDQMPDELESSLRDEAEKVCDRCGYCWERHENICIHATTPPASPAVSEQREGEAAARLRRLTQRMVEVVGADGPCNAEDALDRLLASPTSGSVDAGSEQSEREEAAKFSTKGSGGIGEG